MFSSIFYKVGLLAKPIAESSIYVHEIIDTVGQCSMPSVVFALFVDQILNIILFDVVIIKIFT